MSEQIFCSRYLVPVSGPPSEDSGFAVAEGRIVAVDATAELRRRYPRAKVTDFSDSIVLPCFVNAHTHLELSDFPIWRRHARCADEVPDHPAKGFTDWILQLIRLKICLGRDAEIYRHAWYAGLQQAQASGTGYLGDIVTTPQLISDVAHNLPGRAFVEILGQDPEAVQQQLQRLEQALCAYPGALWGAAPHSPYTLSSELLKVAFRTAASLNVPSTIHMAESDDEVEFLDRAAGPLAEQLYPFVRWQDHIQPVRRQRPLQAVEKAGGLRAGSLLVHAVHVNSEEVARIAATGASVVLCPRSNALLQVGKAPVKDFLRHDVPLALGTDSLASNGSLSLWDEIAFARKWFEGQLDCQKLIEMATCGGARALGLEGVGTLETGARASFQVLRPSQLPPLQQLADFLCQPQRGREVKALYRDGAIVELNNLYQSASPAI
ncbi:MAG: amidohydrolase family protein [Desulfuromonadaceae bacterium]|nr:amidohydrolase family protein [Desulfuromonadaceae bacterium]